MPYYSKNYAEQIVQAIKTPQQWIHADQNHIRHQNGLYLRYTLDNRYHFDERFTFEILQSTAFFQHFQKFQGGIEIDEPEPSIEKIDDISSGNIPKYDADVLTSLHVTTGPEMWRLWRLVVEACKKVYPNAAHYKNDPIPFFLGKQNTKIVHNTTCTPASLKSFFDNTRVLVAEYSDLGLKIPQIIKLHIKPRSAHQMMEDRTIARQHPLFYLVPEWIKEEI